MRSRHLRVITLASFFVCGVVAGAAGAAGAGGAAAPASAPSKDVEIVLTKIDPSATLVSGKLKDASASEMFAKLGDAAGVVLAPADDGVFDDPALQAAAFSTQWDRQPLWDALREACEATNLRTIPPEQDQIGNPVLRLSRVQQRSPASVDGIAVVRLRRLMRDATVDYSDANRRTGDRVHVTLGVMLEPKVRGWAWIDPPRISRATDDRGHALATTRPAGQRAEGTTYFNSSEVIALLDYPPREAGKKLAVVEGAIPIQVASEMATVTFRQPLDHTGDMSADVGPDKLLLKSLKREEGGTFKLNLVLSRGGAAETEEHWKILAELINRQVLRTTLICPNGPAKQNGGGADQRDNFIVADIRFPARDADDQPTAVQVQLPSAFSNVTAKFQFKDVPMP